MTSELARRVDDLVGGYLPALVVLAAAELRVFDALDEPRSLAAVAERIGATADGTARLCRALAALDLLSIEGDRVTAAPDARAAFGSADLFRFHRDQILPPMVRLAEAVRTGRPQHAAWPFARAPIAGAPYDELAKHPDQQRALMVAMDHGSIGVGAAIARAVDLSAARLLVDLGCGGGVVARELLCALPALRIESFDLGAACAVARERSAAEGLAARHTIADGDVRQGVPTRGADAVLLSAILADFPRDERIAILRRARAVLRPGGLVLVSETLLDDDRNGPPRAALLSLLTLAATLGDQLSAAQLVPELEQAGFTEVRVHRGAPRDLIVATG